MTSSANGRGNIQIVIVTIDTVANTHRTGTHEAASLTNRSARGMVFNSHIRLRVCDIGSGWTLDRCQAFGFIAVHGEATIQSSSRPGNRHGCVERTEATACILSIARFDTSVRYCPHQGPKKFMARVS